MRHGIFIDWWYLSVPWIQDIFNGFNPALLMTLVIFSLLDKTGITAFLNFVMAKPWLLVFHEKQGDLSKITIVNGLYHLVTLNILSGLKMRGCHDLCDCDNVSLPSLGSSWYVRNPSTTAGLLFQLGNCPTTSVPKSFVRQTLFSTTLSLGAKNPQNIVQDLFSHRICKIRLFDTNHDPEPSNVWRCSQLISMSSG